jgi:hypothetical protein
MPNWIKNKLFIHGPSDMVKQCTLDIASEDEHISFEKILPKPKDIGDGWYDWCIENWGTKWDVNDTFEDANGNIWFDTAWSTPHELICELSQRYPELIFEVEFADEDLGNNCGLYKFQNADEIEFVSYGIKEACDIWGYDLSEVAPSLYRDEQIDKIIGEEE